MSSFDVSAIVGSAFRLSNADVRSATDIENLLLLTAGNSETDALITARAAAMKD
ncbi:MAG: hypothetical protein ACI92S_001020 [Planctomycetaceae bacterium]